MALAHARVTLTIEVSVSDTWGDDCKLDQVYRQASASAIGMLQRELPTARFRIIGEPKVDTVITEALP